MKTHFIVNPRSGGAAQALGPVCSFAREHGATVAITERPRHASDLARVALAEGYELIVAVGGDGTMNEVAATLVDTGAILGLVPCGSGDGLGRHLGIHGPLSRALSILRNGSPRLIDTGVADGHPFFTVAGLGFEAAISSSFNRLTHRGFQRYLLTGTSAWRKFIPIECSIEHDGHRDRLKAFTLAVANADQYGNNARIAPGAAVDDGLLDLTVVPPVTAFNAIPLLSRLFSGTLHRAPEVWRRRAARFVVDGLAADSILHTDGETHPIGSRVEFFVRPRSLRVMVPAAE